MAKLEVIGLVKYDKDTMEDNKIYKHTKLIWLHKKGDCMPSDPGDVLHTPITDLMYERSDQFMDHFYKHTCQRCDKKSDNIKIISLDCDYDYEEDEIYWITIPMHMITLCQNCHGELLKWLDIPIQDSLSNV